ncbi:MAG: hypothetical protein ABI699_00155 [Caldimonas sp.]
MTTPNTLGVLPVKVPPEVLGKVGECFAVSLSSLQRMLQATGAPPQDLPHRLDAALAEISRLERFGVQIQQLARVLGGRTTLTYERVDLAAAARAAASEWNRILQPSATATAATGFAALDVDAAALSQLLDLGLEYALRSGPSVAVGVDSQGEPARPMLTIRTRRSPEREPGAGEIDEIHWLLFVQLAKAMGLTPSRTTVGETLTLTLGFPDHEAEGAQSAALPHTASPAGRRVLLVEPHDFVREHAFRLLRDIGVHVDAASSIEQARAGLHDAWPDAVITGIPVGDARCAMLIEEIRAQRPRLRVIELTDDEYAFSMSVPGSDSPARVGRDDMVQTLARALAQELDAVWPEAAPPSSPG